MGNVQNILIYILRSSAVISISVVTPANSSAVALAELS